MNPSDPNLDRWSEAAGWRPSFEPGGSPGQADVLASDFNMDNQVGLIDLAILQGTFGVSATRADVARFAQNLGRSYVPSPPPSPAPGAAVSVSVAENVEIGGRRAAGLFAQRRAARVQTSEPDKAPAVGVEAATVTTLRARRRVASPADVDSTLLDHVFSDIDALRIVEHRSRGQSGIDG
jgi:hypothetical protein